MRLELGSAVHSTDGPYGELADVVIDPQRRRVTHLVVAPPRRHDLARLVPVERARAAPDSELEIVLDYTAAEIEQLESLQKFTYLPVGEAPVEDPDWEVGIKDVYVLPYYGGVSAGDLGPSVGPLAEEERVAEVYDRVPKDRIEVRRASGVISTDEHHLGHVDGFVVDDQDLISHIVLEQGHLWGKREITIPISAVAEIRNDEVVLSLTRDQVGKLRSVSVRRHWHLP